MIFNKLFQKWKNEWWIKECAKVASEYEDRKKDLEEILDEELLRTKEMLDLEIEVMRVGLESKKRKLTVEQEEVDYRLKNLEERKAELASADNYLKGQIKLLEAKASPSAVWAEAFGQGMSKSWDLMLPFMLENIDKLKMKLKEDAAMEAIQRLKNAPNKK